MRILVLTNFYPPSRSWGYTQLCEEVTQGLHDRGHTIEILTSRIEKAERVEEPAVHRLLHLESDPDYYDPIAFFTSRKKQEQENRTALLAILAKFRPDIVFVWGMWNLSKALPAAAEDADLAPVVYYIADHWSSMPSAHEQYWRLPAARRLTAPAKWAANKVAQLVLKMEGAAPEPRFENAICVSRGLKEILIANGVPVHDARVIYNGIELDPYVDTSLNGATPNGNNRPIQLLVAGRLSEDKGVHTAIQAVGQLVSQGTNNIKLTIMGDGHAFYVDYLRALVRKENLSDYVVFRDRVPREMIPTVLRSYDVLVFPSIYEEPLARMPMEAMASGLAVIGTDTGGTPELLVDGQTGLTYPAGEPSALATRIRQMIAQPALMSELGQAGSQFVREKFTLERMIHEVEAYLLEVRDAYRQKDPGEHPHL